jgi:16S rRNA (cytidine1402-2'-O)-methyltransferase
MTEPKLDDSSPPWPEQSPWTESGLAQQEFPVGLYVVATPLGNAADMTLRALWVMRLVDCIACEDTRTTAPLLARFGIHRRLLALHQHNEALASAPILERIARGERVALVSDAGTPAISDPGAVLVQSCLAAGVRVIPVPGASSMAAALCVAGVRSGAVHFAGFAPTRGTARQRHWSALARVDGAVVIFEAPHRIAAAAREMVAVFAPGRRVVVARELTKKFESIVQTTVAALPDLLDRAAPRGEYVLIVDAAQEADTDNDAPGTPVESIDADTDRWLRELAKELPASRAAAVAARASGLPRELLYRALTQRGPDAK